MGLGVDASQPKPNFDGILLFLCRERRVIILYNYVLTFLGGGGGGGLELNPTTVKRVVFFNILVLW